MRYELLAPDKKEEYEAFVASHYKGHFLQSTRWAVVKDNWHWDAIIVRGENGAIVGGMSVLTRKLPGKLPWTIMYSPRGPVCDVHDAEIISCLMQGMRALAKKRRAYVFKMDPDIPSSDEEFAALMRANGMRLVGAEAKDFEAIQPRYVFRLNIKGRTPDELMASFHPKTRYNIRVAIKNGCKCRVMGEEAVDEFDHLMKETGLRDGFVTRSGSYFRKILRAFCDNARLYMVEYEGKFISGALCIFYGNKSWYLYGASSNECRNVMPNYLMQWSMISDSVARGIDIYDFRGVSGYVDESHPMYGLYRFKKGFNGDFIEFTGEWDLVLRPFVFSMAEKVGRAFRRTRKILYLWKNRKQVKNEKSSDKQEQSAAQS